MHPIMLDCILSCCGLRRDRMWRTHMFVPCMHMDHTYCTHCVYFLQSLHSLKRPSLIITPSPFSSGSSYPPKGLCWQRMAVETLAWTHALLLLRSQSGTSVSNTYTTVLTSSCVPCFDVEEADGTDRGAWLQDLLQDRSAGRSSSSHVVLVMG